MNNFYIFTFLITLSISKTYACERIDGFLTPEEIESYNSGILSTTGAKITYSFNPETVENIVVGCSMAEHSGHFFGGPFQGWNLRGAISPYIVSGGIVQRPSERRDHEKYYKIISLPPKIWVSYDQNRLTCNYVFDPCSAYGNKVERGLRTTNHAEAFNYALSEEGGSCRNERGIAWEVDPEKSIFINVGFHQDIHIKGNFEKIDSLPFLKNVNKIIIEYDHWRDKDNIKLLLNNAYNILAPNGTLLMEYGPVDHNSRLTSQDIIALSLPNFQLEQLRRNDAIPTRGQGGDAVYIFRAVKKIGVTG